MKHVYLKLELFQVNQKEMYLIYNSSHATGEMHSDYKVFGFQSGVTPIRYLRIQSNNFHEGTARTSTRYVV